MKNRKRHKITIFVPIAIMIIILFLFLFLIMWIDWIYKCRKSAKDNNLNEYLTGFLVMGNPENKNEIAIMDGILGINLTQLVFANRFKDSATYLSTEISNILEFSITDYDENEFINYVKKYSSGENEITKYFIRSMAGLSFSKRIPKFLKTRMMCKINLSIEGESYFFYRNTKGNICSINEIKKIIQAEISKDI